MVGGVVGLVLRLHVHVLTAAPATDSNFWYDTNNGKEGGSERTGFVYRGTFCTFG
jgi:hypothetical protein